MDSLTHIVLGAVIGEACAGKSLGKKALLWGAILQSIPDVDFIASFFLEPTDNLLAHRGITHSLIFGIAFTLACTSAIGHWKKDSPLNSLQWSAFIGIEIAVHLLLDSFNNYGIGLFEPFNHFRISLNIISIADPWFSFWPAIAFVALFWAPIQQRSRRIWAYASIAFGVLYLCCSVIIKIQVEQNLKKTIAQKNIDYQRYFTTPTLFNNLLWYCVIESKTGYYIGYRSVFDTTEQISLTWFPQQRELLRAIEHEKEIQNLIRFSKGYFTVATEPDALVFNDLRFGRVAGWMDQPTEFTFHYYLQRPGKNTLVVQRGRFAELNLKTLKSLIDRIEGE